MSLFTPETRERLREELISVARADPQIIGVALTGSAAVDREDRWSDIDLALCLARDADINQVVAHWSERMYRDHHSVGHLDVWRGNTLIRVFLLEDTLQVDLSFWSVTEFGATGPKFRLLFGEAKPRPQTPPPSATDLIGWAWVYGLHVRSCLARGRVWQAEVMVSGMRDQVLALACLRYGVPADQGRGMDDLPREVTDPLTKALVRSLDSAEIKRAFDVTLTAFLREVELEDIALAKRLVVPLEKLLD